MNENANREPTIPDQPPDGQSPGDGPLPGDSPAAGQPSPPTTGEDATSAIEEVSSGEEVPEWLLKVRAKREADRAARAARSDAGDDSPGAEDPSLDDDLPDWVKALEFGEEPPSEVEPAEAAPLAEVALVAADDETLPSDDEVPPVEAVQPADDAMTVAVTSPGEEELPPPDEEPDWVKDLPETLEQEDAPADPAGQPSSPPVDTPAWLQDVMAQQAVAQQAAAALPASEMAPPVEADQPAADEVLASDAPAEPAPPAETVRERRARRRRERRTQARRASTLGNSIQSLAMVGAAAVLIATIFTFWTPANFLSEEAREGLRPAYATLSAQNPPTPVPTPAWMRRIGVVSGHWGPHPSTGRSDPGAVCPDGLTEAEVNRNVATFVVQELSGLGFDVDLLDEWDPRLDDYQASVLLSIHADSCHEFDLPGATGFKVAPPSGRTSARADDLRLRDCLVQHFGEITGLPIHPSLTRDMTEYHSFREISSVTPASIVELGFMFEDRDILENQPELLAEGLVAGVKCFLDNVPPTPLPEVTPWPTIDATPTPLETPGLS